MTSLVWPPAGTSAWRLDREDQPLPIDSALLAITLASQVDDLLHTAARFLDGTDPLGPTGIEAFDEGLLCDVGSDGWLTLTVHVRDDTVHGVEILFDEVPADTDPTHWLPLATLTCPTTTLVCGDPGLLHHHTDDPFIPPADSYGSWAVMALPGPGLLTAWLLKEHGQPTDPNLGIRTTWNPI